MATDWNDPHYHTCYYCKYRGWTSDMLTGDGIKHYSHCHFDSVRREEFKDGCNKWVLSPKFEEIEKEA